MNFQLRQTAQIATRMGRLPGFQPASLRVWLYLIEQTSARTDTTTPSQTAIAAALQLARETVCRAVDWLRRHGFVATAQRMVRQADGSALKGSLRYRVLFALPKQIAAASGLATTYRALLKRGQLRSSLSQCDLSNATPPNSDLAERLQAAASRLMKEEITTLTGVPLSSQSALALAGFYERQKRRS